MQRIRTPFLFLLSALALSCAGTRHGLHARDRTVHAQKKPADPELGRHLTNIRAAGDRNRFVSFFKSGAQQPLPLEKDKMEQIITTALRHLGRRYVFGRLDCSSFMFLAFDGAGVSLPRNAEGQARYGRIISDRSKLERGDLLFFTRTYRTAWFITHVGLYLGKNRMLHASSDIVRITEFPEPGHWWKDFFVFGTRLIKDKKEAKTAWTGKPEPQRR